VWVVSNIVIAILMNGYEQGKAEPIQDSGFTFLSGVLTWFAPTSTKKSEDVVIKGGVGMSTKSSNEAGFDLDNCDPDGPNKSFCEHLKGEMHAHSRRKEETKKDEPEGYAELIALMKGMREEITELRRHAGLVGGVNSGSVIGGENSGSVNSDVKGAHNAMGMPSMGTVPLISTLLPDEVVEHTAKQTELSTGTRPSDQTGEVLDVLDV